MLKSLRHRLLIWFVLSTILISASSFVLFKIHKSTKQNQQKVSDNLNYFRHQFLKDQTQVANFFATETSNKKFYLTGESDQLFNHYRHASNIDSCFVNCANSDKHLDRYAQQRFADIRETYSNYCMVLDSLVYKIYQKGYKNYGLEGELASYMYKLEQFNKLSSSQLANLKLAEKEYIHDQDTSYIEYVNKLCNSLITATIANNRYSSAEKVKLVNAIKSYKATFNSIVRLNTEIGQVHDSGLKQDLSEIGYKLEELVDSSINEAENTYRANMIRINVLFGLLAAILIAIAIVISIITSKFLVKHLENLTGYINQLAKNDFSHQIDFDLRESTREVRHIYLEFRNMLADLRIREKQRDRAVRIAEENQQRYQELADLLPQCIYETDRIGNLTYVNKAWYKTFGYNEKDVDNGINLIEILNAAPNSNLFGYTKVENNDFIATRLNGSKFPATVFSDVIKKGMRVIGRRGIIIDSTLRNKYIESLKKETARAITSDKHKSSFLANMSHEIRTPMNSIIGFTNMLASKEIPDDMKSEFIDHIQTSSEMLLNLIDDIIDIAKIEDGQLKIKKTDCEPIELIENLAASFEAYKTRAEKDHLDIRTKLPVTKIHLRTDKFRLKQIITNLMSNAIKFTDKGYVEIGLNMKSQRTLEFFVRDTGMGMTKEELRTVFDRFKRTKLSEEKKITGTGLGLAISKNLVEMLGGSMWVTSEPNKGTCFTFELPYIRTAKPVLPEKKDLPEKAINWEDKKFLIAEDDEYGFTYLKYILEKTGVQLIRAHNGQEAINALSFHKDIDLILMDLQMPVLNGLDATSKIKQDHPQLPIIAQTAFAMEGDRTKCLKAGCDDYITKPIHEHSLIAKINQFIETSEASPDTEKPITNSAQQTIDNQKAELKDKDNPHA